LAGSGFVLFRDDYKKKAYKLIYAFLEISVVIIV